jgi:hypothetical protein
MATLERPSLRYVLEKANKVALLLDIGQVECIGDAAETAMI